MPAEVRRRLELVPGSVLAWEADGDAVTVRRVGRYTTGEVHAAFFRDGPPEPRTLAELKEGIREHIKARHARG